MRLIVFKIKNRLGVIKRGIFGIIQDNLEKIPSPLESIHKFKIGESRKSQPIYCYQLGKGNCKLLFVSAIHGNEVGTVKLAYHLINWAYRNMEKLKESTLFIIPCLNPDGYASALKNPDYFHGGQIGRFNSNDVDLNRNFDTPSFQSRSVWSFGKNFKENIPVFCGDKGNPEPEIAALTKFIIDNRIKVLFIFHNAGREVMGNNNTLSQKLIEIYSQKTGFKCVKDKDWQKLGQTGTAKEWCELNDVAYVETESSTRWGSDWKKQKEAIMSAIFTINT